jgi:hypothetical protein
MNKELLENCIAQGYSTCKIGKAIGKGQTTVRYWLNKYGLKTKPNYNKQDDGHKTCPQCKEKKEINKQNFYIRTNGMVHSWCKKCNNTISYNKQKEMKVNCVNLKGGKCQICGYAKYVGSMDFHHLDPSKKEYSIGDLRAYSMKKIKKELDKCILVCRNCHGEIHAGLIELKGVLQDGLEPSTVPL